MGRFLPTELPLGNVGNGWKAHALRSTSGYEIRHQLCRSSGFAVQFS
jgi:hypothetical protein